MSDNTISREACLKYAEICRLRASRHIDIEQALLFQALTKICEQAAEKQRIPAGQNGDGFPYG